MIKQLKRINLLICSVPAFLFAGAIHVNQLGYYPYEVKTAIVVDTSATTFSVVKVSDKSVVLTKDLTPALKWAASQEKVKVADFSDITSEGEYKITVSGCTDSYNFKIYNNVNTELAKASIKAFYFNRASMALDQQYAGKWARPAGHPDTSVLVHNSAASSTRPTGTKISAPGGWYDAGDYNKYIVNSGITTYTLMASYNAFSSFYDSLKLNIPESSNSIPDLLDEVLWNLRWMLKMQDPEDGGVYHKLTTANFCGFIMPKNDLAARYVVKKGTAATLDFAAVAAQASRIFRKFDSQMPEFADSCLQASLKAWDWARKNPSVAYDQKALTSPVITTGEYGNIDFGDEFKWAATELYLATKRDSFFTIAYPAGKLDSPYGIPGWPNVATLSLYSLFLAKDSLTAVVSIDTVIASLTKLADAYASTYASSPYRTTMSTSHFVWGSNSFAANQGMALALAYLAKPSNSYKNAAIGALDYLTGKNPLDYCYVTGMGSKSPMNLHHRPSGADGIVDPVPGFLVGGPNVNQDDALVYPSAVAAFSYVDDQESYASNEVAINWNAPLVFLSGALEAIHTSSIPVIFRTHKKTNRFNPTFKIKGHTLNLRVPSEWKNAQAIIINPAGRILAKINFDKNQTAMFSAELPTQVVIVSVSAENSQYGKSSFSREVFLGK
jgi:endoglucanase